MTEIEFQIKVVKVSRKITNNLTNPSMRERKDGKFRRMKPSEWVYRCIHHLLEERKALDMSFWKEKNWLSRQESKK